MDIGKHEEHLWEYICVHSEQSSQIRHTTRNSTFVATFSGVQRTQPFGFSHTCEKNYYLVYFVYILLAKLVITLVSSILSVMTNKIE